MNEHLVSKEGTFEENIHTARKCEDNIHTARCLKY